MALYSVSLPDFTHASMSGLRGSLSHSRAACSVRMMNSYSPVCGAMSDPTQRMENSSGAVLSGTGDSVPKSNATLASVRSRTRSLGRKRRFLKYAAFSPRSSETERCGRKAPMRSATAWRYWRTVRRASSTRAGRLRSRASFE